MFFIVIMKDFVVVRRLCLAYSKFILYFSLEAKINQNNKYYMYITCVTCGCLAIVAILVIIRIGQQQIGDIKSRLLLK